MEAPFVPSDEIFQDKNVTSKPISAPTNNLNSTFSNNTSKQKRPALIKCKINSASILRVDTRSSFRPIMSSTSHTASSISSTSSSSATTHISQQFEIKKSITPSNLLSPLCRIQLQSPTLQIPVPTAFQSIAPVAVTSMVPSSIQALTKMGNANVRFQSRSDHTIPSSISSTSSSSSSTSTAMSSSSSAFVIALQPFVSKPTSFSTAHTTMPPLNRSESPILRKKRRSIHSMFEEEDTSARDGFMVVNRPSAGTDRTSSSDSTDEELLMAAKIGSRGTSRRRRMRLISRSFSSQDDNSRDTRMMTTTGIKNDANDANDANTANYSMSEDGNNHHHDDDNNHSYMDDSQLDASRRSSMSSVDMSLMRRSAPLRRASSSVSTSRVGARPLRMRSRRRDGARSLSNTPRGSPTPEDAECAAIIQAVMHQVGETTRLNPSPPPEDLDRSSGNMLPTISRSKIPDLKCIEASTLCDLMDGGWKERFSKFIIIDCRFDYEYCGGHIHNAEHCSEPKDVITKFFKETPKENTLPVCLVFHCEFSKNRAPKM